MKTITVNVEHKTESSYDILIGVNILEQLNSLLDLSQYSQAAIITDTNIAKFHLQKLQKAIKIPTRSIILSPGESAKTIQSTEIIWKELADAKFDRKSVVINLGGGVIGDMGGFAASTYMRGIDFINIPTTILAQVDESVGGKTGIDFAGIKNLIGTFEQPSAVVIDTEIVKTLPDREFISGFAEIIKHGLIVSRDYYDLVTSKHPREFSEGELIEIIAGSCEIKRKIVEEDTKEKGHRKVLNFGHTIGHAIEALLLKTETPILHGEAISIGMVAEAKISQYKKYISEADVIAIEESLVNAGLPTAIESIDINGIKEKIKSDKKNVDGKTKWTLLDEVGIAVYDEEVSDALVTQALEFISNE
jgi:3-dehydroquinate synthase